MSVGPKIVVDTGASASTQLAQMHALLRQRQASGEGVKTVLDEQTRATVDQVDWLRGEVAEAHASHQASIFSGRILGTTAAVLLGGIALAHNVSLGGALGHALPLVTVGAGIVGGFSLLGALSNAKSWLQSRGAIRSGEKQLENLSAQLDAASNRTREARMESLRGALASMTPAQLTWRLAAEVEQDPEVAQASYRVNKAEHQQSRMSAVVDGHQTTDVAERMQAARKLAETFMQIPTALCALLPGGGAALAVWQLCHTDATAAAAGFVVAAATVLVAQRRVLPSVVDSVARAMVAAEIRSEMEGDEARLAPLRQSLDAARDAASARVLALVDVHPQPSEAAPARGVKMEDGHVVVGGVTIQRRASE